MRVLLLCLLFTSPLPSSSSPPLVSTRHGTLRGYEAKSSLGKGVKVFKSIPFAAPPVGSLRWSLPRPPSPWKGVRDATVYSSACLTNSSISSIPPPNISEDCLYLNIFSSLTCTKSHPYPIVFYIHGGMMNYDSAVLFNDSYLIDNFAAHNVVLAIPAFRIGFSHIVDFGDSAVPSNLGAHDILAALKYMAEEGSEFGGKGEEISLFGHSYGATMALLLTYSPLRRKQTKIVRTVAMSPTISHFDDEYIRGKTTILVEEAGCVRDSPEETVECMRKKDGLELLAIQRSMEPNCDRFECFGRVALDSEVFPWKNYPQIFADPPDVDCLVGTTAKEMDYKDVPIHGKQLGMFTGAENLQEIDEVYVDLVKEEKLPDSPSVESMAILLTAFLLARTQGDNGNDVYLYSYDMANHSFHTDDLSYLMGVHVFEKDENEEVIASFYPDLFINFTKTGVPSPEWKKFDLDSSFYSIAVDKETGRMPSMRQFYHEGVVDFWLSSVPSLDRIISMAKGKGKDWKAGHNHSFLSLPAVFCPSLVHGVRSQPLHRPLPPSVLLHPSTRRIRDRLPLRTGDRATVVGASTEKQRESTGEEGRGHSPHPAVNGIKTVSLLPIDSSYRNTPHVIIGLQTNVETCGLKVMWLLLLSLLVPSSSVVVKTSYGRLRGYEVVAENGVEVAVFKSIPFAAPPVGSLRWSLPVPPSPWEGVREATEYAADCWQNTTITSSTYPNLNEDCLYLNVFTPSSCLTGKKKCPLAVYFHGGGMITDSATNFNDSFVIRNFASRNMVFAIPAFRLALMAVLDFEGDQPLPHNLGVHDVMASLRFLRGEGHSFGAELDDVSFIGSSGGAGLAVHLAYSPMRQKEFPIKRVVSMSPSIAFQDVAETQIHTQWIVEHANCSRSSPSSTLACLREVKAEELMRLQGKDEAEGKSITSLGGVVMRPPLFPWHNITHMLDNPPVGVDLLIGSTIHELDHDGAPGVKHRGSYFVDVNHPDELQWIYERLGEKGYFKKAHYQPSLPLYLSVYTTAHSWATVPSNQIFLYSFDQPTHNRHAADLYYLMGIHPFPYDDNEKVLSGFYPELFANFTLFGCPSPNWEPFEAERNNFYSIKVDLETDRMPFMKEGYEADTAKYWLDYSVKIDGLIDKGIQQREIMIEFLRSVPLIASSEEVPSNSLCISSIALFIVVALVGVVLVRYLTTPRKIFETKPRVLFLSRRGEDCELQPLKSGLEWTNE